MKNVIIPIFISLSIACSIGSGSDELTFQEFSYGIYKIEDSVPFDSEESPSGNYHYGYSRTTKTIKKTDTIIAKLNISFGASYQLNSKIDKEFLMEALWTPPTTIIDDQGAEFNQIETSLKAKTNQPLYSLYVLEKEYEMVKGEWLLELFYQGKKLHQRKFILQ